MSKNKNNSSAPTTPKNDENTAVAPEQGKNVIAIEVKDALLRVIQNPVNNDDVRVRAADALIRLLVTGLV